MFHMGGWWSFLNQESERPKVDLRLLQRVLAYGRPYWGYVTVMLLTIVVTSLIELIPPLLYRDLIDHVLPNRNVGRLNLLALGMVGIPVLSGVIGVIQRYFSAKAGEGIIFDLRQQLYSHVQGMSIRFFTHTKSGEIISRLENDVVGAQGAIIGTLPTLVTSVVTLVSTLVVMISIEWRLAILAVLVLPLFVLPARRVGTILREISHRSMELNSKMSSIIAETLSINGTLLVKTFGRQRHEIERFGETNQKVRDIGVRRALVGRWFFLMLSLVAAVGTALVYWVGGHFVLSGAISTGTIVAFVAYLARLYGPISSLSNLQVEFLTSMVSFERVFQYLDQPQEIRDKPNAIVLKEVQGRVEFHDVSFTYYFKSNGDDETFPFADDDGAENGDRVTFEGGGRPLFVIRGGQGGHGWRTGRRLSRHLVGTDGDEEEVTPVRKGRRWALRHVSFAIEPGQLVALVGPSGAGKTTVTYLLPRLYDPTEGKITLDGHDLRDVTLESLAKQIGMVTQETYLFHDTVRANLTYAKPDATDEELDAACRAANIYDLIASLPKGYDTVVGERGYRLSGGEKQRLAIARVILKNPRILILDEATSHLDSHSEALIKAALAPLFKGRTSLVIAHRLSTVLAADKILVLDQGQIVESGTHQELLVKGGLYAHLYKTQFGEQQRLQVDD